MCNAVIMMYETIGSQLMRALRGHRSQVAFSRRLGYRSNVAATWEGGRRWPTAAIVFRAAERVNVDVIGGLHRFYRVDAAFLDALDLSTSEGVAALLEDSRRDLPFSEVAARTGASRFQVSRWFHGISEPRLPDLLRLIDATTQRLLDFVAIFVDPASLPAVAEDWARLEASRTLFWRLPHAQLVLLALELQPYRDLPAHDEAWLADRLGLEVYEVVGAVERLLATAQIRWDDKHLAPDRVQTVDTRRHPEAGAALKRWWAKRAVDRLDTDGTSWSYNAFTVSEADHERIVELYRSTYRQMRAIVASSEPAERLVFVQQVVLPLET